MINQFRNDRKSRNLMSKSKKLITENSFDYVNFKIYKNKLQLKGYSNF